MNLTAEDEQMLAEVVDILRLAGDLQREMPGLMGDVRIGERPLSVEEIAELAGLAL